MLKHSMLVNNNSVGRLPLWEKHILPETIKTSMVYPSLSSMVMEESFVSLLLTESQE